jgi:hypothetical protein
LYNIKQVLRPHIYFSPIQSEVLEFDQYLSKITADDVVKDSDNPWLEALFSMVKTIYIFLWIRKFSVLLDVT